MLRPPTNDGSRTKMTVLVNPIVNREQLAQMVFEPLILRRRIRSNCESSSGHATDIALDSDNGIFHLFSIYEDIRCRISSSISTALMATAPTTRRNPDGGPLQLHYNF